MFWFRCALLLEYEIEAAEQMRKAGQKLFLSIIMEDEGFKKTYSIWP